MPVGIVFPSGILKQKSDTIGLVNHLRLPKVMLMYPDFPTENGAGRVQEHTSPELALLRTGKVDLNLDAPPGPKLF